MDDRGHCQQLCYYNVVQQCSQFPNYKDWTFILLHPSSSFQYSCQRTGKTVGTATVLCKGISKGHASHSHSYALSTLEVIHVKCPLATRAQCELHASSTNGIEIHNKTYLLEFYVKLQISFVQLPVSRLVLVCEVDNSKNISNTKRIHVLATIFFGLW